MSKSQAIAFFEEISKNQQLAQEVEKVVGGKDSDEAKAKELLALAKQHNFNFTKEEAVNVQGTFKTSLSPEEMLEVSGGAAIKSSIMALTLLAGLGVGGAALTNIETSAMKPNHQQASPQIETDFREGSNTAWFDPHYTTTYFDDNSAYFGDNSAYFGDSSAYFGERSVMLPAPSLYDEQHQGGNEHAREMSFYENFEDDDFFEEDDKLFFDEDEYLLEPEEDESFSDENFEDNNPFKEDDEMGTPSELYLAPEATQEQSQSVPYVFLNYKDGQLYQGDISETLDAYGATARMAALWDGVNCTLKLYGPEWGLNDSSFLLNFDVSEGAVLGGTGLLIVSPGNTGLRIYFNVQESSFRDRILLWFEKVDGEVIVPDNWGILSIDSSSYSTPQLSVMNFGDIRFTTDEDFEMEGSNFFN